MKNDKELVLLAISKDASLIKYASENLKNDRDVGLAAVNRHGHLL